MRSPAARLLALAVPLLAAVACNTVPVESLEKSFTMKVRQSSGTGEPVGIDVLWVVDNSASMCEEQFSLADNFSTFTQVLSGTLNLDPRVAVVRMDTLCLGNPAVSAPPAPLFNDAPAATFPPSCQAKVIRKCTTDVDCEGLDAQLNPSAGTSGTWTCREASNVNCIENPNGSINTECKRGCSNDAECRTLFQDDRYICQKPSSNQGDWGCMLPPLTAGCPDKVGPILDAAGLDDFRCLATVGVNQNKCFKYEQGMQSALDALDRGGVNGTWLNCTEEQEANGECKRFLRDDAYLVVVFVSDEDDCSAAYEIAEGKYDICAFEPTVPEGGPLIPVSHYVNRFKSLKSDPSKVIVAAIGGDATDPSRPELSFDDDPAFFLSKREAFVDSKTNPFICHRTSYICASNSGRADWGSRYQELTDRFGGNGIFTNICSDQGIGPALVDIADQIVRLVNKLCLPKPVDDDSTLVVTKRTTPPGATGPTLVDLAEGEYQLVPGGDDCRDDEGRQMPAIIFSDPPGPGEEVIVTYKGDPLLGL